MCGDSGGGSGSGGGDGGGDGGGGSDGVGGGATVVATLREGGGDSGRDDTVRSASMAKGRGRPRRVKPVTIAMMIGLG